MKKDYSIPITDMQQIHIEHIICTSDMPGGGGGGQGGDWS
jgi:hypothetical protein